MALPKKSARPGPKPRQAYSAAELSRGARLLRLELEAEAAVTGASMRPPVLAAVGAYLYAADFKRGLTHSLVVISVQLADGGNIDRLLELASIISQRAIASTPKLRAALARSYKTPLGRAFAVFRVLAKGLVPLPARNAPEGDLLFLFEQALLNQ